MFRIGEPVHPEFSVVQVIHVVVKIVEDVLSVIGPRTMDVMMSALPDFISFRVLIGAESRRREKSPSRVFSFQHGL